MADGSWQTLVSRRLLAVVLKQRLPAALIRQERALLVDSPVAVVGTLRHLLRPDARFEGPSKLRAHSLAPLRPFLPCLLVFKWVGVQFVVPSLHVFMRQAPC